MSCCIAVALLLSVVQFYTILPVESFRALSVIFRSFVSSLTLSIRRMSSAFRQMLGDKGCKWNFCTKFGLAVVDVVNPATLKLRTNLFVVLAEPGVILKKKEL